MRAIRESERKNSFFRFGGMEILSVEQDGYSSLWKIKLATDRHYVVSKEFDRTKGMYANAPDDIVRIGLMDYSNSLLGEEMSIYDVMTGFIDRCFDDGVFGEYTSNAAWICMDFPHYEEIEDMLASYDARIIWDGGPNSRYSSLIGDAINKYYGQDAENALADSILSEFKSRSISSVFVNGDPKCEKFLRNPRFSEISMFKAQYSQNGDFRGFQVF